MIHFVCAHRLNTTSSEFHNAKDSTDTWGNHGPPICIRMAPLFLIILADTIRHITWKSLYFEPYRSLGMPYFEP